MAVKKETRNRKRGALVSNAVINIIAGVIWWPLLCFTVVLSAIDLFAVYYQCRIKPGYEYSPLDCPRVHVLRMQDYVCEDCGMKVTDETEGWG